MTNDVCSKIWNENKKLHDDLEWKKNLPEVPLEWGRMKISLLISIYFYNNNK